MTNPISQHDLQRSTLNVSLPDSFDVRSACDQSVAPLKISVSQLTTMRWSLLDEVFQLVQTGYDAIGLWRPKVVEFGEHRAADLLQEARLPVASLSFAGGFTGGCGFSYLDAIEDGRQAIAQASTLGAENLIVVGGSQNGHTDRHARRLVVDALRELGESAAQAQVKLAILPMHRIFNKRWTFLNSLDRTLEILDQIGHSHVCLAFDIYHLAAEPRLIERIPEIAGLTSIVQLSDCHRNPVSEKDRLMPGAGTLPLEDVIQAFQLAGYTGYFDIQVWSDTVWQSNYAHLIEQSHAAVKAMSHRGLVSK